MARKGPAPIAEGADDRGEETQALSDQAPTFRRLKPDEELGLLLQERPKVPNHALDAAPENSKIIVCPNPEYRPDKEGPTRFAVMATPEGAIRLPPGDEAHGLPVDTRIYKTPKGYFQLTLPEGYETPAPLIGLRAADVIHDGVRLIRNEVTYAALTERD